MLPIVGVLGRWWVDWERQGPSIPDGPVVVAANHFSNIDPVMVSLAAQRPIRYLAVDELYGNSAFFDRLTLWLGAIPMSRTRVPLGALRTAITELRAGGTIGVFPEGVRVWNWGEAVPKRGAAWLARRTGVPLVPVAIWGTDLVMGRGGKGIARKPASGATCEPIFPGDYEDRADPIGAMTEEWSRRIGGALEETKRRRALSFEL